MLHFEKLDVYQASIKFLAVSATIIEKLPTGYSNLADQLKRASLSIPLNIAEGAGKPTGRDEGKFYGIARGSSMECGAILDACRVLGIAEEGSVKEGKLLIERIVSMLT